MREYTYSIKESEKIDDEVIRRACSELDILEGYLIISRYSIKKETYRFKISGRYRATVYNSGRESKPKKFR